MAAKKKRKRKADSDRITISSYDAAAEQTGDDELPGRGEGGSESETPPPARGVG